MEPLRIPTENPQADLWRMLSLYQYPANVHKYLKEWGFTSENEETVDYISGSLSQGQAYFVAAHNSPLDISPLLFCYGTTNLLSGTLAMVTGAQPNINNHGIIMTKPENHSTRIAEIDMSTPFDSERSGLNSALWSKTGSTSACPNSKNRRN